MEGGGPLAPGLLASGVEGKSRILIYKIPVIGHNYMHYLGLLHPLFIHIKNPLDKGSKDVPAFRQKNKKKLDDSV